MRIPSLIMAIMAGTLPASAQVEARFLGGTYVMSAEACDKLNKLADGATRSVATVPWSVDETGFHSWEGGCDFTKVTERRKGREWVVQATCIEGPDEDKETYTFVKNANGSFAVTLQGERKPRTYTRCDVKKGK